MKHAHQHREYRSVRPFDAPDGIVTAEIDSDTGELATPRCPHVRSEVFIAGTQPVQTCRLHGDGHTTQVAGWDPVQPQPSSEDVRTVANARVTDPGGARVIQVTPQTPASPKPEKKTLLQRIGDFFK
jgi:membrane carboxypeptidase/penicillin-binding protein